MLFSNTNVPYTYLIGWSKLGIYYYGRQTRQDCHPDQFWKSYFTSSDYVEEFRQLHGEPDIQQIRQRFHGKDRVQRCVQWEERFLDRVNAVKSNHWLNKANGRIHTSGQVPAVDKDGRTFLANCDDSRWATGEIVHTLKGTTTAIEVSTGNTIKVEMTDSRWETGEIIGIATGLAPVYEVKTGKIIKATSDDVRWATGEIVSIFKGKAPAKVVATGEFIQVLLDDPRWNTGEIAGVSTGNSVAVDSKTGEKIYVSCEDPRWKTGEIHGHRKGKSSAIVVETGEKIFIPITDSRWETGEVIGVNKGLKHKKNRKDAISVIA